MKGQAMLNLYWYVIGAYSTAAYLIGWMWFVRGWNNWSGASLWAFAFSPIVVPILALKEVRTLLRPKQDPKKRK